MAAEYSFDSTDFDDVAVRGKFLDKGAFGEVFGPFLWRSKMCALKRILSSTDGSNNDTELKTRNSKELWMSLDHPNLLKIYHVEVKPPALYIMMEYAAGRCLRYVLDQCNKNSSLIPLFVAIDWARQIAEGMFYLHDRYIVHRDLKSKNVMMMDQVDFGNKLQRSTIKVADFDEIRELEQTVTMSTKGTLAWMAPEVWNTGKFSKASDVYSFGVMLWEMITQDIPFRGRGPAEIFRRTGTDPSPPLPISESFPKIYKKLMLDCLEYERYKRPSFSEILSQLSSSNIGNAEPNTLLESCAVVAGTSDGLKMANDVIQISLERPGEVCCLHPVSAETQREAPVAVFGNTMYFVGLGINKDEIWKYDKKLGWTRCTSLIQGRRRQCIIHRWSAVHLWWICR